MAKTVETRKIVLTEEEFDKKFPIVRASMLSLEDSFLKHKPKTLQQERLKTLIIVGIKEGLKDFRRPAGDLSFDENDNYIYKEGEKPAFGKSAEYGREKLKEFMPEKNSRMGTLREYHAFLCLLIKYLIEEQGYKVADAWHAVCDDSIALGHYCNSENTDNNFEPTGSRKVGAFYDLANTRKIVQDPNSPSGFSVTSGHWTTLSNAFCLENYNYIFYPRMHYKQCVPWCVMDV